MINDELKKQLPTKNDVFELICDIANDYDGCRKVSSLMELVDELAELAAYGQTLSI